ncbi:MAG: hypothetical protein ACRDQD_13110, partial [Nocardioidaceae bacterium]
LDLRRGCLSVLVPEGASTAALYEFAVAAVAAVITTATTRGNYAECGHTDGDRQSSQMHV